LRFPGDEEEHFELPMRRGSALTSDQAGSTLGTPHAFEFRSTFDTLATSRHIRAQTQRHYAHSTRKAPAEFLILGQTLARFRHPQLWAGKAEQLGAPPHH